MKYNIVPKTNNFCYKLIKQWNLGKIKWCVKNNYPIDIIKYLNTVESTKSKLKKNWNLKIFFLLK